MAQYTRNPSLEASDLLPDPMAQLQRWIDEATAAGQIEPTAMSLATVDADGQPSVRMVLFKGVEDGGLSFYTDHRGRKAQALAAHPRAAVCFWWDRLERQVRVEGPVSRLSLATSERYFASRPRGSQLGAWTSCQSAEVADRATLEARLAETTARFAGAEPPLPPHWGGYALHPRVFEFWQGRRDRLHDRLCYRQTGQGWTRVRLEP